MYLQGALPDEGRRLTLSYAARRQNEVLANLQPCHTGISDVDQQVDNKGPLDSEQHAIVYKARFACVHNRLAMVSLWPFEWLLRFHQHINWELGLGITFI